MKWILLNVNEKRCWAMLSRFQPTKYFTGILPQCIGQEYCMVIVDNYYNYRKAYLLRKKFCSFLKNYENHNSILTVYKQIELMQLMKRPSQYLVLPTYPCFWSTRAIVTQRTALFINCNHTLKALVLDPMI